MPISEPKPPKKKTRKVEVRMDEDLYENSTLYAKKNNVSLGMLIRSLLRRFADPNDPRPLPPDIEQERKRPRRGKKPPSEDE